MADKSAMSRALGAAFLTHQVEQLEKSVTRGPASGNWRDRRQPDPAAPARRPRPRKPSDGPDKDADLVVVDASVLVHALHQLKKWARDGRTEIVIIPLEALNTLDLLKKGTSALAQRARAASRVLEAQVGTNPRIRVQRDDAFVPWDQIDFAAEEDKSLHLSSSPEWVRRMICCARWEVDHARTTLASHAAKDPTVVLAVLSPAAAQAQADRPDANPELPSPVPLPAPSPHLHRYEPRSAGVLIAHWASRARIPTLEFDPAPLPSSSPPHHRAADDSGGGRRPTGRGRINSHSGTAPRGLVERPPAVMQMMEAVAQPSRVVRVLARGEKLDP